MPSPLFSNVFNFFSRVCLMVTSPSLSLRLSSDVSPSQGSKDTGKQGERERARTNEWRKVLTHVASFKLSISPLPPPLLPHPRGGFTSRPLSLSLSFLAFFRAEKCLCECRNCRWPYGTNGEAKRGNFGGENLRTEEGGPPRPRGKYLRGGTRTD